MSHSSDYATSEIGRLLNFVGVKDLGVIETLIYRRKQELAAEEIENSKMPELNEKEKNFIIDAKTVDAIMSYRHRTDKLHSLRAVRLLVERFQDSI